MTHRVGAKPVGPAFTLSLGGSKQEDINGRPEIDGDGPLGLRRANGGCGAIIFMQMISVLGC